MSSNVDVEADQSATDVEAGGELTAIARRGALAFVLAVVANAAVTTVARMGEIGTGLRAMTYPSVIVLTAVGVVGATVVYAALYRVTSRPNRTFVIVAAGVLFLSIVPDFTYVPGEPGGSLAAGAVLAAMHVVTAAITVWLLVDWRSLR